MDLLLYRSESPSFRVCRASTSQGTPWLHQNFSAFAYVHEGPGTLSLGPALQATGMLGGYGGPDRY